MRKNLASLGTALSRVEAKRVKGGNVYACKCSGATEWIFYTGDSWAATSQSVDDCAIYSETNGGGTTCVFVSRATPDSRDQ
jgi:hypothetical protein